MVFRLIIRQSSRLTASACMNPSSTQATYIHLFLKSHYISTYNARICRTIRSGQLPNVTWRKISNNSCIAFLINNLHWTPLLHKAWNATDQALPLQSASPGKNRRRLTCAVLVLGKLRVSFELLTNKKNWKNIHYENQILAHHDK